MSSQSKERFPSITLVSHKFADDGGPKPGAKIACDKCDATQTHRLTGPFNAFHAADRFRKAGWSIEAKATRCPSCVSNGRRSPAQVRGDSSLGAQLRLVVNSPVDGVSPVVLAAASDPVELTGRKPKHVVLDDLPPALPALAIPLEESLPVTSAPTPEPARAVLTSAATPRPLSVEERAKVRRDLDAVFDDAAGMYLDGASDRSIADKHKLPWASVAAYREAAYGPIKTDAELEGLKEAVKAVREFIEGRIREVENAAKEDRAATKAALANGERGFADWKKDMESRLEQNGATLKDGVATLRASLAVVQDRLEQAARSRGLRV